MNSREAKADPRSQIHDFLVSRRERISPGRAGLPLSGSSRRVKGLRREEVALLAGVSVDYYVRIERGNLAGVSAAVLAGVASALQFDEAESEHLFTLARTADSAARLGRPTADGVRPELQQVLDAITDAPAWVCNARLDILATNPLATVLYSQLLSSAASRPDDAGPANTARFVYLDPAACHFFLDYDQVAQDAASLMRVESGRNPDDVHLFDLIDELSAQSELFRQHWASNDVKFHRSGGKRLRHPAVGVLDLNFENMQLADPGLMLTVYTAAPDTPSADGLALLTTWAAASIPGQTGQTRHQR